MRLAILPIAAGVLLTAGLAAPPANAQLLDGVLGGDAPLIDLDSSGDGQIGVPGVAMIGISSTDSGTTANGTVLGGGGYDLNVPLGQVLGGNSGVNVDLPGLDNLGVGELPGGLGDIIDDLLGGNDGANGANGNNGLNGSTRFASLGGGAGGGGGFGFDANCSVAQGRTVLEIAAEADDVRTSSWRRAANVQVIPVRLCQSARAQVSSILDGSPSILALRGAAASDSLITASLARTRYDIEDIFAVRQAGGQLTVYVY